MKKPYLDQDDRRIIREFPNSIFAMLIEIDFEIAKKAREIERS